MLGFPTVKIKDPQSQTRQSTQDSDTLVPSPEELFRPTSPIMESPKNQTRQSTLDSEDWTPSSSEKVSLLNSPDKVAHPPVRLPGFGFEAPIIEFDFAKRGNSKIIHPTPTVDDVLYGDIIRDTMAPDTCRRIHLPVNHLGWAEDLLKNVYETRDQFENEKWDAILRGEPFGNSQRDGRNRSSFLDSTPQARSLRFHCRSIDLDQDRDEDESDKYVPALALYMPFVHWDTDIDRAKMNQVMEEVRQARERDIDSGERKYLPDLESIESNQKWCKEEKLLCAYLYSDRPVHPRRSLDQFYHHMLEDTQHRDEDQVITRYYHNLWKRDNNVSDNEDDGRREDGQCLDFPFERLSKILKYRLLLYVHLTRLLPAASQRVPLFLKIGRRSILYEEQPENRRK